MDNIITTIPGATIRAREFGRSFRVLVISLYREKVMLQLSSMMSCTYSVVVEWTGRTWKILRHSRSPVSCSFHLTLAISDSFFESKQAIGGLCSRIWVQHLQVDRDMLWLHGTARSSCWEESLILRNEPMILASSTFLIRVGKARIVKI